MIVATVLTIFSVWRDFPAFENSYGGPGGGIDMLPKPVSGKLPLLISGGSQQEPDWIARNGEGRINHPRAIATQAQMISGWRAGVETAGCPAKPAVQSLYVDLMETPDAPPQPIHLGFRSGMNHSQAYLKSLEEIGINHVAMNLRFNQADLETTLQRLADELLPDFPG